MKKKNSIICCLAAILTVACLSGCSTQEKDNFSITGFAFDTTYTITLYEGGSQELLNSCVQKCSEYEAIFSRTLTNSQLYQINEIADCYQEAVETNDEWKQEWENKAVSYDKKTISELTQQIDRQKSEGNTAEYQIQEDGSLAFTLSQDLAEMFDAGLQYSVQSDGAFDITIEPLTSLWNFSEGKKEVPAQETIQEALKYVDYQKLSLTENTLTFQMPGMGIDFGGIAKGYIADALKQYLTKQGVSSAVINLGGNILCIGSKSREENFSIGIQQPFADRNETVAAVSVADMSVVSSGIYERYFEDEQGKRYHHILDPKTGYPYDNGLIAVTILSEKSVQGDALSTTCFSLGKDEGLAYVDSLSGVYAMFITEDEKIWYSEGFEDFLIEES